MIAAVHAEYARSSLTTWALSNVFLLFVFCFEKSLIPNVPEWSMHYVSKWLKHTSKILWQVLLNFQSVSHFENLVALTTRFSKCVSTILNHSALRG